MKKATDKYILGQEHGGLIFTQQIAEGWMNACKIRLPRLHPQLDQMTLNHYIELFLKPEYLNLIRLAGAIEYWTAELIDLCRIVAKRYDSVIFHRGMRYLLIEPKHIDIALHHEDQEFFNFDVYYPFNVPSVEDEPIMDQGEISEGDVNQTKVDLSSSSNSVNDLTTMMHHEITSTSSVTVETNLPKAPLHQVKLFDFYRTEADEMNEEVERDIGQPEVDFPFTPETRAPNSIVSLAGRTLQVIVKIANIELTPEKPTYGGGAWHVEGMKNESIVASGIYYINSTNITESCLAFRQAVEYYEPSQDDSKGSYTSYGLERDGPLNQPLGSLITKSGRAIAFPNIYQHCVHPFQLADPTQPGKRQILVFFLVDPTIRVTSTSHVPPQQRHWLKTATGEQTPTVLAEMAASTSLISDLIALVGEYYSDSGVINQAEACVVREELMKERKYFVDQNTRAVYSRSFSFCEH